MQISIGRETNKKLGSRKNIIDKHTLIKILYGTHVTIV